MTARRVKGYEIKKMTAVLGATALVVSCLGGCGSGKDESASASKTTAKSADDVDLSEKVDISIGVPFFR